MLTWPAWEQLRASASVLAADLDPAWDEALRGADVVVEDLGEVTPDERAGRLVTQAVAGAQVLWFGSPDGDPGLTDALAAHLQRHAVAGEPPEIEVLTGSHDVPGARLLDLVQVMDTLRSPGGCPWDAKQTHESLLPYLLEETYEVAEAVESGDRRLLREELGDLLLQVVFHARVAQENPEDPFDVDDVAAGIVAKLVHRHPHVFGDDDGDSGEGGTEHAWEKLKAIEKPDRGVFEGIPSGLPALLMAQKMAGRLQRPAGSPEAAADRFRAAAGDDVVAEALLDVVLSARGAGQDAETSLRSALARLRQSESADR